jgi:hypothetical protein
MILASLASAIADAFFSGVTDWVVRGAASLVSGVGSVLAESTAVPFNAGFAAVYSEVEAIGAPLAAMFMALAVIRAIIRQDLADLAKMVLIRLPLAFVASGIALELVVLALQATDSLSASMLSGVGVPASSFTTSLAGALIVSGGGVPGGFAAFVLGLLCGVIAFTLWIELVIRSSAIAIATLFLPLALAGTVWSASATWARRLAEILASLILSKLVIVGVFALAVSELGNPTGLTGLVQGTSLLLLATFAPWTLLRLVPSVESGLIAQLETLGERGKAAVLGPVSDGIDYAMGGGAAFSMPAEPQIPDAVGKSLDTPEFRALVAHFEDTLPPPTGGLGWDDRDVEGE